MFDKKLVGEAARKANLEKARLLVAKKETPKTLAQQVAEKLGMKTNAEVNASINQTMMTKPTEATTDNKEVLSDATVTVVQKQKKSTTKKPTAAQLGVAGVVGNRGKVRSENPIVVELPCDVVQGHNRVTAKDIAEDLNEYWKDATAHHGPEGYGLIRYIEGKLTPPGSSRVAWWTLAEKGETIHSLVWRAIKSLSERQVTAPAVALTPTITRIETPTQIVISGPAKPKTILATPKLIKPRGEGWNGYSTSAIFRWSGKQGWTKEDCLKVIDVLKLTGVGAGSLPTLLKAGRDNFRLPDMKPEHAEELNIAAGKITVQVYSKSK